MRRHSTFRGPIPCHVDMDLVTDASALIGELLRERGRRLLRDRRNSYCIAAHTLSEVRHELPRRVSERARHGHYAAGTAADALSVALHVLDDYVAVIPVTLYADFEVVARRRVPRDPRGWPTVALALALEAGIWTADADFLGCGVPTWTTETLLLDAEA